MWVVSSCQLKTRIEPKVWVRENFFNLIALAKILVFACPWTGTHTINSGIQTFRLRFELYIKFLEFPACWLQVLGILNLHHVIQFLIIIYICLYLSLAVSVVTVFNLSSLFSLSLPLISISITISIIAISISVSIYLLLISNWLCFSREPWLIKEKTTFLLFVDSIFYIEKPKISINKLL